MGKLIYLQISHRYQQWVKSYHSEFSKFVPTIKGCCECFAPFLFEASLQLSKLKNNSRPANILSRAIGTGIQ